MLEGHVAAFEFQCNYSKKHEFGFSFWTRSYTCCTGSWK